MAFDQYPNGLTDQEVRRIVKITSDRLVDFGNGARPTMLTQTCLGQVLLVAVLRNRINLAENDPRVVISPGDRQRVRASLRELGFGFSESAIDLVLL